MVAEKYESERKEGDVPPSCIWHISVEGVHFQGHLVETEERDSGTFLTILDGDTRVRGPQEQFWTSSS